VPSRKRPAGTAVVVSHVSDEALEKGLHKRIREGIACAFTICGRLPAPVVRVGDTIG
jgi:hypothetical protein